MIKQWMEFCKVAGLDAKELAEACMDSLPDYRALFHRLALDAPRKHPYTVFVRMDTCHYIATFHTYSIEEAKRQALAAAREANDATTFYVVGVADGDITLLEWTDSI
jgi:hypothetical protein